jgi:glycosyltransferase involved in cell wall biosynthesis
MKLTILAFNFGPTKSFTNGPGMSLYNFCKAMAHHCEIDLFLDLKNEEKIPGISFYSSKDSEAYIKSVKEADLIHHWSGLTPRLSKRLKEASNTGKKIILGPNLLDCVELEREKKLIEGINFYKILSVNDRLKYQISFNHDIHHQMIETFIVGPDLDEWAPSLGKESFILWKGHTNPFVQDLSFALKLKEKLTKYNFNIMGHPKPYNYKQHINQAKQAKLYINTSLSETKSQTLMESWASGVPSVTHPKVYLHGINYETGIITSKTEEDYEEAIAEIMENSILHSRLSDGAYQFCIDNFSKDALLRQYSDLIK